MHILIVDDDEEDASFFSDAIKDIAPDVTCHTAHTCDLAKEFLAECSVIPSYIFLDAYMYPCGGKECLTQLGQIEQIRDSKIIIHSGALTENQIREFMTLGADGVMMKPTSYEMLCKNLSGVLQRPG